MAFGTVEILVVPVFCLLDHLQEFCVFQIPLVGIPGKRPEQSPDQQGIGNQGNDQIDNGVADKQRHQADYQAGAENNHIEPVGSVSSGHETLQAGTHGVPQLPEPVSNTIHADHLCFEKFTEHII